ncbi:MAG: hypothetical protein OXC07_08315 [Kistimonas sp.]|nr:hypothetical protein [Kistimonas sp.]
MRISQMQEQRTQVGELQRLAVEMARERFRISSGRALEQACDDPLLSVRAMDVKRRLGTESIWLENIQELDSRLSLEETLLSRCIELLDDLYSTLMQAHNGAMSPSDTAALAASVRAAYDSFITTINTHDTEGIYLFGGARSFTPPVTLAPDGAVQENHDQGGPVQIMVAQGLWMDGVDTAESVFFRIPIEERTPSCPQVSVIEGITFSVLTLLSTAEAVLLDSSAADFQQRLVGCMTLGRQASSHLLKVQTALGGRMKRLEQLTASQRQIQLYSQRLLGQLQDLDYPASIARINQLEMATEAARKTLAHISQASFFQQIQP